jgi:hypothetical protein
MGTDAKLIVKRTGDKMYVDRKYNIVNGILELHHLDYWIESHGLPIYLFQEVIIKMRDMWNCADVKYKAYEDILKWFDNYDEFDFVKLVDEHSEEY